MRPFYSLSFPQEIKLMKRVLAVLSLLFSAASMVAAQNSPTLLLQQPTLNRTEVAFVFGGDLWAVSRQGGDARRLTTGVGAELRPYFSPDGALVAFTGEYDGNLDVYIVPIGGGVPRRLTYHPGADVVQGWTPDGRSILFRSSRDSYSPRFNRLFTVSLDGG